MLQTYVPPAGFALGFATHSLRRLLRQLVEMKLAAAEVEGVGVVRKFFAEGGGEGVDALLALLFDFEQASFLEDAEVLGDVVGRDAERVAQLGHGLGSGDELAHEAQARRLAQCAHGAEAVE